MECPFPVQCLVEVMNSVMAQIHRFREKQKTKGYGFNQHLEHNGYCTVS